MYTNLAKIAFELAPSTAVDHTHTWIITAPLCFSKKELSWFGVILTKCFWSRCFMSYFAFFCYLYVSSSGSNTSVGEERPNLSTVVYL